MKEGEKSIYAQILTEELPNYFRYIRCLYTQHNSNLSNFSSKTVVKQSANSS